MTIKIIYATNKVEVFDDIYDINSFNDPNMDTDYIFFYTRGYNEYGRYWMRHYIPITDETIKSIVIIDESE